MIFDLDGTLIDSSRDLTLAVNGMLNELGFPKVTHEQVQEYIGDGTPKLAERSLKQVGAIKSMDDPVFRDYYKILLKHYEANLANETTIYPGVKEFLEQFNSRHMAVVTNKPSQFTGPVLRAFDLEKFFEFWAGGDTFEQRKPDPYPILKAIEKMNVSPKHTVMVGDGDTDIKAGQAAGTTTIAALYGNREKDELHVLNPDYEIEEFSELIPIITNLENSLN